MAARHPITPGIKFHRFTTIREVEQTHPSHRRVLCRCDCGEERIVQLGNLRSGNSKSCGCHLREVVSKQFSTHGESKTRLYQTWCKIIARTSNSSSPDFHRYGGRGISMCNAWRYSFEVFRDWALTNGYADDLTIERKDVNGNYEPDNCTWILFGLQARNRRTSHVLTINGETKCLAEWVEKYGADYQAVHRYIKQGMDPVEALTYRPTYAESRRKAVASISETGRRRRQDVTLPRALQEIRLLIERGVKPTQQNCASIQGYWAVREYYKHTELVALAIEV